MIESLSEYLVSEEVLNSRIRRLTDNSLSLKSIALKGDTEGSLLGHPLDVYLLIRRMAIDWKEVTDFLQTKYRRLSDVQMRQIGGYSNHTNALNVTFDAKLVSSSHEIITNKELTDAAYGVISLVNTYDLDIKSLVNGFIRYKTSSGAEVTSYENQSKVALNAFDCYLIGKQTYDNNEYLNAKQWLTEAVERLDDMTSDETIADILKYLSFCELKIGKPSEAQKYKRLSAAIKPDIETNELISETKLFNDTNTFKEKPIFLKTKNTYELCRGERLMNDSIASKLKCFHLNTTKTPFLQLTRIQVEEMYKSPQIVVIHDFLMKPRHKRSYHWLSHHSIKTAYRGTGDCSGVANSRTDTTNSCKQSADVSVPSLALTRIMPNHTNLLSIGDVMATWITFLNDVGAGGVGVFPELNVTVWPTKYSTGFWYSFDKSGQLDRHMHHSACPILVGHKWIANKWIHSEGQEFRKPCDPYDRQSRHTYSETYVI
ncbi:unnamed protein product [Oppiella nova]|uniref:Prolyl 4-hydroxylase alpha subunit domain-containing protein n=1 Tax=Oppiella nova TaxID=334625 RepID=A0A7R9QUW3_9ACAR|nr:unnamed protein product [Oppiella nova]CAG2176441.1 unnamed protein product [Oppiella nova]